MINMENFYLGDVVKLIGSKDENECYIITDLLTDLNDFSQNDSDEKVIKDMEYELMKMYPISDISEILTENHSNLELVAKKKSSKHKLLLQFILRERKKYGWFDIPDYILALKYSEDYYEHQGDSKKIYRPEKDIDVIRYDLLKNIYECFDAINSLTWLNEQFGDDTYLQLREITQKRLVELVGLLDTTDNCLDAMNILTSLYESFGEEDYLKLREIAVLRLEQLA